MLRIAMISVALGAFALAGLPQANADVAVRGYYRSNGTYVAPHYRSDPDSSVYNNWSTYGNVNPYTGRVGTRHVPTYSPSYYPRSFVPQPYAPGYYHSTYRAR